MFEKMDGYGEKIVWKLTGEEFDKLMFPCMMSDNQGVAKLKNSIGTRLEGGK